MEFLTTYGWAIMVVLVMIGALAYFGVLTPSKYLPPRCIFTTGLTCKDYIAEHNGGDLRIRFVLENGLGSPIIIPDDQIAATFNGIRQTCENVSGALTLASGSSATFTCVSFGASTSPGVEQRVKVAVALNYTEVGGSFIHPISGDIQTTVQ